MNRRDFLKTSGLAAAGLSLDPRSAAGADADVKLRITPVSLDIGPGKSIKTVGYNGSAPGPILRFTEGKPVTVDVFNETDVPETVHWHGQLIPSAVDGSVEEGTPPVPAHGHRRYRFTPKPAGTRWYHTHTMSMDDLHRGSFTGMFGFLIVEGANNPGNFDQEYYLALRDW
jgi:FtsP/CotA-like multicopper oxidase with cupredoxin domain